MNNNFEDVSTLGGASWDDDESFTIAGPPSINNLGPEQSVDSFKSQEKKTNDDGGKKGGHVVASSNEYGDIGEEEIAQDQARYYAEHAMVVDGFKCPDDFIGKLSPMEFEEMVGLFQTFDADKSGTIDIHEAKKVLHFLGLDSDMAKAEQLMNAVDADHSGEIDFEEFCSFIVMVKRGDERVAAFSSIIEKIGESPLFELERQVKTRDLIIKFKVPLLL
jgi:hypothetical protein